MKRERTLRAAQTLKQREKAVRHSEFQYCSSSPAAPIIFVFGRAVWTKPTGEQLADFDRREGLVRENGGYMRIARWEIAGKNQPFTKADVEAAISAVKAANPDLEVYTHWNGAGCYSLSVGARHAAARKGRRNNG